MEFSMVFIHFSIFLGRAADSLLASVTRPDHDGIHADTLPRLPEVLTNQTPRYKNLWIHMMINMINMINGICVNDCK